MFDSSPIDLRSLLRKPTAFLPLVMSVAALGVICAHIAVHGTAPQADEGAAAHVWQLLMLGQLPLVLMFAFSWFSIARKAATKVLALQLAAGMAAVAPVFLLRW